MENVTIGQVATVCATILALYTFGKTMRKDFNSMLDAKLDPMRKQLDLTTKMQLQMMNHTIDGNHIEKLKALRDEVNNKLIDIK